MTNPAWFEGFDTRQVATTGAEVCLRTGGDPDAPPLLLLHGFPQTHVMWQRVAQRLKHDFFLVLPDLRGYGDSSHAPGLTDHSNYSKRAMAQDLVEVMDFLGIADFNLCGHDRGGRVAHRLALDHPARISKLCVIDIAPTLDMYARTDFDFARAYYHWFHLIQPAPLPELMIGGNARAYLHAKLGGWGSGGLWPHRARGAGRVRALLLPRRIDPHRLRGLPRQRRHRPGTRPRQSRARREDRLRHPGAVGRARRGAAPVRSTGTVAGPVRRRGDWLGHAGRAFHPRTAARGDCRCAAELHGVTGSSVGAVLRLY